jgi:hypothetical protein
VRTPLSKVTTAVLLIVLSGCRVRTTSERLRVESLNRPQTAQNNNNPTNPIDSNNNNDLPSENKGNTNNDSTTVSDNNPPTNNPNNPTGNGNNDDRTDSPPPRVSIPKIIIRIINRQVPESSSSVGLLSFGVLSSVYFYNRKKARQKNKIEK